MFIQKRRSKFDLLLLAEDEYYLSDESVVLLHTSVPAPGAADAKHVKCAPRHLYPFITFP